jgi:AGZA family xanthine/uracil permease-like MFS transporter
VESAAGVGEGARTGLASLVTGLLGNDRRQRGQEGRQQEQQAAAPALVVVGFLMLRQIRDLPWDDWTVAVPAFLALILMPFTYSITNGIGAAIIAFVVLKAAFGRVREVPWLVWITAVLFAAYFALGPIERWLGV